MSQDPASACRLAVGQLLHPSRPREPQGDRGVAAFHRHNTQVLKISKNHPCVPETSIQMCFVFTTRFKEKKHPKWVSCEAECR